MIHDNSISLKHGNSTPPKQHTFSIAGHQHINWTWYSVFTSAWAAGSAEVGMEKATQGPRQ